jgi:hypothetical protein
MRTPSYPPNLGQVPSSGRTGARDFPAPPPSWLPHSGLTDLLAARALLGAMEPGWRPEVAAGVLAQLAAGHDDALRRALARIQLRSLERSTPVTERAASALRLATGLAPRTRP